MRKQAAAQAWGWRLQSGIREGHGGTIEQEVTMSEMVLRWGLVKMGLIRRKR